MSQLCHYCGEEHRKMNRYEPGAPWGEPVELCAECVCEFERDTDMSLPPLGGVIVWEQWKELSRWLSDREWALEIFSSSDYPCGLTAEDAKFIQELGFWEGSI
jgi:hypothetical protein